MSTIGLGQLITIILDTVHTVSVVLLDLACWLLGDGGGRIGRGGGRRHRRAHAHHPRRLQSRITAEAHVCRVVVVVVVCTSNSVVVLLLWGKERGLAGSTGRPIGGSRCGDRLLGELIGGGLATCDGILLA